MNLFTWNHGRGHLDRSNEKWRMFVSRLVCCLDPSFNFRTVASADTRRIDSRRISFRTHPLHHCCTLRCSAHSIITDHTLWLSAGNLWTNSNTLQQYRRLPCRKTTHNCTRLISVDKNSSAPAQSVNDNLASRRQVSYTVMALTVHVQGLVARQLKARSWFNKLHLQQQTQSTHP